MSLSSLKSASHRRRPRGMLTSPAWDRAALGGLTMTRRMCDGVVADSLHGEECILRIAVLEVFGAQDQLARVVADNLPAGYHSWAHQQLLAALTSHHQLPVLGDHCAAAVAWGRTWQTHVTEERLHKVAGFLLRPWPDTTTNHEAQVDGIFVMCRHDTVSASPAADVKTQLIEREIRRRIRNVKSRRGGETKPARESVHPGRLNPASVMVYKLVSRAMSACRAHESPHGMPDRLAQSVQPAPGSLSPQDHH